MTDSKPEVTYKMTDSKDSKITTDVKTKDPKRVEAGKRLAAISKAAKEKKMKERIKMDESDSSWTLPTNGYMLGLAGLLVAGVSLYFTWRSDRREVAAAVADTAEPVAKTVSKLETL